MGKQRRRPRSGDSGGGGSESQGKHTAPTPGLEKVVFTHGTPRDAAVFEDVVKQVTSYLASQGWKGVSKLRKALESLEDPSLEEPVRPKRWYWKDESKSDKTLNLTGADDRPLEPVIKDALYAVELQIYADDKKVWRDESAVWDENQTRAYSVFESHCPESLIEDLKVSPKWEDIQANHDVIGLLKLIRASAHGKRERK